MTSSARRRAHWIAALAAACSACVDLPDFARPELIDRPRVLAIIAEPPEVHPGDPVALSILIAGADSYDVSWRACGAFDGLFGGSQYGDEEDDEGCGAGRGFELGADRTAELPGTATQALFESLELAERILGGALPADTIEHVRQNVGLPFTIEATVNADGKRIRAVKRVLISVREQPNSNPPPPAFTIDGVEVRAVARSGAAGAGADEDAGTDTDSGMGMGTGTDTDTGTGSVCTAVDGSALEVATDAEVELAPIVDADDMEPWLEHYQVIDMRGELLDREETAFYSWFSTGGEMAEGVTKSPLRNEIWSTPAAGCHSLWLVVRDGHGGTSACRTDVAVGDASCD